MPEIPHLADLPVKAGDTTSRITPGLTEDNPSPIMWFVHSAIPSSSTEDDIRKKQALVVPGSTPAGASLVLNLRDYRASKRPSILKPFFRGFFEGGQPTNPHQSRDSQASVKSDQPSPPFSSSLTPYTSTDMVFAHYQWVVTAQKRKAVECLPEMSFCSEYVAGNMWQKENGLRQ